MFFDNWQGLVRVLVVGTAAYTALIFLLRISGKRTLSKMNAFDLVVTVALGSTLTTVLLSKQVPLAEGVLALGLLIFFQFIITWLSVKWQAVSSLIKAEPRLLFFKGEFLQGALKAERVNEEEILQAMRAQGASKVKSVEAVTLETDGSLSVVTKPPDNEATVLSNVAGHDTG